MKYFIGQKVKTKMKGRYAPKCSDSSTVSPTYHHWWKITNIADDHMVLTDSAGNIMVTDKEGNGLCPKQGHYIYKIKL